MKNMFAGQMVRVFQRIEMHYTRCTTARRIAIAARKAGLKKALDCGLLLKLIQTWGSKRYDL